MTEDPIHYKWRLTWGTTRCSGCSKLCCFCGFLDKVRPGVISRNFVQFARLRESEMFLIN